MGDSFIDYISVSEYEIKVTLRCNHYKCMKSNWVKPRTQRWLDLLFVCLWVVIWIRVIVCACMQKYVLVRLFVYVLFFSRKIDWDCRDSFDVTHDTKQMSKSQLLQIKAPATTATLTSTIIAWQQNKFSINIFTMFIIYRFFALCHNLSLCVRPLVREKFTSILSKLKPIPKD